MRTRAQEEPERRERSSTQVRRARAGVARLRGDVPAQARYEVSSRGGLGMVVGALGGHVREYGRPRRRRSTALAGRGNA